MNCAAALPPTLEDETGGKRVAEFHSLFELTPSQPFHDQTYSL
jgi:hypothetical protein